MLDSKHSPRHLGVGDDGALPTAEQARGTERRRAVVIFPDFENARTLERLQRRFGPLPCGVAPHVTVVLPFECSAPNGSLERHLEEAARSQPPFSLTLRGIVGNGDGYLFLRVRKGGDEIQRLHDRLCSGILAPQRVDRNGYLPHLTVGRLDDGARVQSTVQELEDFDVCFRTRVRALSVVTWDSERAVRPAFEVQLGLSTSLEACSGNGHSRGLQPPRQ